MSYYHALQVARPTDVYENRMSASRSSTSRIYRSAKVADSHIRARFLLDAASRIKLSTRFGVDSGTELAAPCALCARSNPGFLKPCNLLRITSNATCASAVRGSIPPTRVCGKCHALSQFLTLGRFHAQRRLPWSCYVRPASIPRGDHGSSLRERSSANLCCLARSSWRPLPLDGRSLRSERVSRVSAIAQSCRNHGYLPSVPVTPSASTMF